MICRRDRVCCPGRHSLRSTIYRLGGVCRYCPHSYDGLPRGRWPSENMPCKLDEILHFKSNSSLEDVYFPAGITRTRNFCELCRTFIPVPRTSVSSVRPVPQYPVTGTACFVPARNFSEFCITSIPVPETSGSSVRLPYPYPESTNPTERNLGRLPQEENKSKTEDYTHNN